MSGNQRELNHNQTAFEYVAGTLRDAERREVDRLRAQDPDLEAQILFWEEQFMGLQDYQRQSLPADTVWEGIQRRISRSSNPAVAHRPHHIWSWLVSASLALALLVVLLIPTPAPQPTGLQPDYVAVLTNPEGEPLLTVLTAGEEQVLQLKWEIAELPADSSVQLWAVSRRDGMIRSLGVFDAPGARSAPISNAEWRLIQDAESLLLTEEEAGGSALDRPSDTILAQGVCVRLRDA